MRYPHLQPAMREAAEVYRLCVVDVGARSGLHRRWAPFHQFISAVGFEPDSVECERLNEVAARNAPYPTRFLPHALGSREGPALLHITSQPGCSSLLEPNLDLVSQFAYGHNLEVTREVEVSVSRLDAVCSKEQIAPDVLKVDAQGAELSILDGGGAFLDQVLVVELEVAFAESYRQQPLFRDVDRFMSERGFCLMGLRRSYWRREIANGWPRSPEGGLLMHGDALYVNRMVLDSGTGMDRLAGLKALVALTAYRQYDTVAWLLATPHPSLAGVPEERRKGIARDLVPQSSVPRELVLRMVASRASNVGLRSLVDGFRPTSATDWHDPAFF